MDTTGKRSCAHSSRGGDFQVEVYPEGCAVVDNPPFSILSRIVDWYNERNIPFFLFGPTFTILGLLRDKTRMERCCVFLLGNKITYHNGAEVNTSYITNMDREYNVRIEAELREKLETINDRLQKRIKKTHPKYDYPMEVLTGKDYRLAKHGQTFRIRREQCYFVSELDAMKDAKKQIFGGGLLLSKEATAERMEAERAVEDTKAERMGEWLSGEYTSAGHSWRLSDRERRIIENMRRK